MNQPPNSTQSSVRSKRRAARIVVAIAQLAAAIGASAISVGQLPAISARADAAPGGTTATQITGTVFQDFNSNGVMNTAGDDTNPAVDNGVANVTVSAFAAGSNTATATTTTAGNGLYTLTGLTGGALYRIEFSNLPADFESSFKGASGSATTPSNGTSVQFAAAGTSNLSFGINRPCEYCQANPLIAINAFVPATTTNVTNWSTGVFTYFLSTDTDGHALGTNEKWITFTPGLAEAAQAAPFNSTGNVYGLAWARNSRTLFSSAFFKKGVAYGPAGAGGIYKTSGVGTGAPVASTYVDLNSIFAGSAGTVAHGFTTVTQGGFTLILTDTASGNEVGKESFGDLEINKDESALYVVNLNDRKLYRIPTSGVLNATTITSVAIPAITGCAADTRPFALSKDALERLHVGAVCSAETGGTLSAQVWRYDETSSTFTSVYAGNPFTFGGYSAWSAARTRQPQLTDLAFDGPQLYLGIRDRWPDTAIPWQSIPPVQSYFKGEGDVLCATLSGATYTMETNGVCGPRTSGNTNPGGEDPGPGGKSFFWNDIAGDGHQEAFYGALSQIPGAHDLITTKMDSSYRDSFGTIGECGTFFPNCNPNAGGIGRYSTQNGDQTGAYDVYGRGHAIPNDVDPYYGRRVSKTSGIGDIETLCDPAPLQLGNRVWRDSNNNGIQDAGEPALPGVVVALMIGAEIYTTTTDSAGEYYFSSAALPDSANANNGIVMPAGGAFMLKIDPAQSALTGLALTGADAAGQTDNNAISDVRDSDGTIVAGEAKVNGIFGQPGQNNHGYDFGFAAPTTVSLGNRVWFDANNNGMVENTETNVGAGVSLTLFQDTDSDGVCSTGDTQISTTVTSSAGYYTFVNLAPSTNAATAYYVVVAASNFVGAGQLAGYNSSTGQTASGKVAGENDKDHGAPVCGAVASTPLALTAGDQPTGEPNEANDATADANSNQTIDFGFYRPAALGNYVWRDDNRNGVQDEPASNGQNGVTVKLKDANGATISETVTANDVNGNPGYYTFTNLAPGTYATMIDIATLPAGAIITGRDQGGNDATDSDGDPVTGMTPNVTLGAGEVNPTLDFGFYLPVGLGDYVWFDLDKDGQQEAGEPPVAGVTVTLSANGQVISTTTTNSSGLYIFPGLTPGIPYTVCFVAPDGFVWTIPGTTPTSGTDSNVNPATGCAAPVTLGNDEFNPTIDGGLITPIALEKLSATTGGVRGGVPVIGSDKLVTYTIRVENTSSQIVRNVVVSDVLPANLTYVAGSAVPAPLTTAPLTWNIAQIAANSAVTITFRTTVGSITGTIRNVASVLSSGIVVAQDPADIQAAPTAVALNFLRAEAIADGVTISWATALELNSLGFDVMRAEGSNRGSAIKVNSTMIAARSTSGSAYSFVDTTAKTGVSYAYWLVETELSGATTDYGPVLVERAAVAAAPATANNTAAVALAPQQTIEYVKAATIPAEAQSAVASNGQTVVNGNAAAIALPVVAEQGVSASEVPAYTPVALESAAQTSALEQRVQSAAQDSTAQAPVAAVLIAVQPVVASDGIAVVNTRNSTVRGAGEPGVLVMPAAKVQTRTQASSLQAGAGTAALLVLTCIGGLAAIGMLRRKRK